MGDVISVKGLELWGYHGVFDHEKKTGQRFIIDLEVDIGDGSARSDDVSQTLNYAELIDRVEAVVAGPPVDLIETLAEKIATQAWHFPQATTVRVTVHKPQAPVSQTIADVAVTISRNRPES